VEKSGRVESVLAGKRRRFDSTFAWHRRRNIMAATYGSQRVGIGVTRSLSQGGKT